MPLKFKIYYWCCVAMILPAWFSLGLIFFLIFSTHTTVDTNIFLEFVVTIAAVFFSFKPVYSLFFLSHLKKNIIPSNRQLQWFKVSHGLLAILTAFLALSVASSGILTKRYYTMLERLSDIAPVITLVCSIYMCIIEPLLVKQVKKKVEQDIEQLGEHITS